MKWFKHLSNASNNEKLAKLRETCGLEGYGFYWAIIEIVAAKMEPGKPPRVEFPARKWGSLLGISPKKFKMFGKLCANFKLFEFFDVENSGKIFQIEFPNMLKYMDNHFKNLQVTNKSLASDLQATDKFVSLDKDKDKDKKNKDNTLIYSLNSYAHTHTHTRVEPEPQENTEKAVGEGEEECFSEPVSNPKKTDAPSKGNPEWAAFNSCYNIWPVQQGKEAAWKEWMRLKANGTLAQAWEIRDAILIMIAQDSRWRKGMVPNFDKWLAGKRWNDAPVIEREKPPQPEAIDFEAQLEATRRKAARELCLGKGA